MKHEDDMNCGNTNLNTDMIVAVVIANSPEKKNGTSTGFEPMASSFKRCSTLQCSTIWAMKTDALKEGQFVAFILTREKNKHEDDVSCGNHYKFK